MHWTDDEVEQLKKLYRTTPNPVLAKMFNRSPNAIYYKACNLGVTKNKIHNWSKKDIEKLIELYPNTNNNKLTKLFNRSHIALRTKAHSLGLKKSDEFMREVNKIPNKGQFKKGCIPWCKGLKLPSTHNRKYHFKKGQIPHNKTPEELRDVYLEFRRLKKNINGKIKRRQKNENN